MLAGPLPLAGGELPLPGSGPGRGRVGLLLPPRLSRPLWLELAGLGVLVLRCVGRGFQGVLLLLLGRVAFPPALWCSACAACAAVRTKVSLDGFPEDWCLVCCLGRLQCEGRAGRKRVEWKGPGWSRGVGAVPWVFLPSSPADPEGPWEPAAFGTSDPLGLGAELWPVWRWVTWSLCTPISSSGAEASQGLPPPPAFGPEEVK